MRKAANKANVDRFEVQLRIGSKIESEIIAELDAVSGIYGAKRELLMALMSSGFQHLQKTMELAGTGKDGIGTMASLLTDTYFVSASNYYIWAKKNAPNSDGEVRDVVDNKQPFVTPIDVESISKVGNTEKEPETNLLEENNSGSSHVVSVSTDSETEPAKKKSPQNKWGGFRGIAGTQSIDDQDEEVSSN